jgi:hypothetical protein
MLKWTCDVSRTLIKNVGILERSAAEEEENQR